MDCVDLFSFKSYGIYGFFRLFGSVVYLAFILELYSVAYNSTVMFNLSSCNDVSILNEKITVILYNGKWKNPYDLPANVELQC